jgi:hypothetical protein
VENTEELVSVIDLANQLNKRKQRVFKVLNRLGIETTKLPSRDKRGQLISYITNDEARLVFSELQENPELESDEDLEGSPESIITQQGLFYLLLLEPEHDPGRFKVGFTSSLQERLRALRCSAPFTKVVKTWPCKLLWEKTAIECVTENCERLHTEVFRTEKLETVLTKCDKFFELMPKPQI